MTEIAIIGSQPMAVHRARVCVEALGHVATILPAPEALRLPARRESVGMIVLVGDGANAAPAACIAAARMAAGPNVPILATIDRVDIAPQDAWLKSPLNEFIAEPYTSKELSARIHAMLWRAYLCSQREEHVFGAYRFLSRDMKVELHGNPIKLTPKVFELALFFFKHSGLLITRADLHAAIWPCVGAAVSRTVDTHISMARRYLNINSSNGYVLRSVYRRGYTLQVSRQDLS